MSIEVAMNRLSPLGSNGEVSIKGFDTSGKISHVDMPVKKVEEIPAQAKVKQENPDGESAGSETIQKILDDINSAMYSYNKELHFELNQSTKDLVIKVVNGRTGEILKQFPAQEILDMRERLLSGQTTGLNLESKIK